MKSLPPISSTEYEIMKIIWKHAPINTNKIVERLFSNSKWTPKTIHTMLMRLVKKGVLIYYKQSRVYVYTPLIPEKEYLESESHSLLNRFFGGQLNSMLLSFLDQGKLTEEEIRQMVRILEERRNKGL